MHHQIYRRNAETNTSAKYTSGPLIANISNRLSQNKNNNAQSKAKEPKRNGEAHEDISAQAERPQQQQQ